MVVVEILVVSIIIIYNLSIGQTFDKLANGVGHYSTRPTKQKSFKTTNEPMGRT
jgi:hypothetical protein